MTSLGATDIYGFDRGKKFFELSNHLGNVLVTVTDRKNGVALSSNTSLVEYYLPDVASASDYYPFGMTMPGRTSHSDKYRYGFNGQEKSTELDPNGNSMTAEFWQYDARLGRRWNVDPVYQNSSYSALGNNPLSLSDPNGADTIRFNRTLIKNRIGGRWDGHSDNLTTKGKVNASSTFSISITEAKGKDVFLFTETTVDDGLTTSVTTQLNPYDSKSAAGKTKGKNLYFDGLVTTERNNKDWETIGKFMNSYKEFNDYMVGRDANSANWRAKALSIEAMEGIMPAATMAAMGSWIGFRYFSPSPTTFYRAMSKEEYAALQSNNGLTHMPGKELFVSTSANYSRAYLQKPQYDVLVQFTMKPGAMNYINQASVVHRTAAAARGWASRGNFLWKSERGVWNLGIQQNTNMFNPWIESFKIIR